MIQMKILFKKFLAPVACIFFGVAANDAHALDFGCRDKEQIKQELMAENQVPVVKFYSDATMFGDTKTKWNETFFTMNAQNREGYRMSRKGDTQMCITGKFADIRLYNPQTLDQKAFLDSDSANTKGSGINNIIYGRSQVYNENPVFRGVENSPYYKSTTVTYVIANPLNGNEGGVRSATLEGKLLENFTKKIPAANSQPNVDHGAELTNTGKLLVGVKDDSADQQAAKPQ